MTRLLLLLPLLFIFACQDDDDNVIPTDTTTSMADSARTVTFLALGDSYTIGTSVTADQRWPAQLAQQLAAPPAEGEAAYNVILDIVATNGWTTNELIAGLNNRQDLRAEYDLVSLLIGVNNQYRGQSAALYAPSFETLLNRAIARAGDDASKVFVVSIPDYAFTPFGAGNPQISQELDEFNAVARDIADRAGVPFLNITPISREGLDDPELVASDRLHPSGKQYRRWVEEVIAAEARRILAD